MPVVNKLAAVFLFALAALAGPPGPPCPAVVDETNEGVTVRRIVNPGGHEHNLYYYRNPWNADSSLMVGIHSDLEQKNWRVALYSGEGCFIKELFPIGRFDWRVVWDRRDPAILYTTRGSDLYRFNVHTGEAETLRSFAPLRMKPSGLSLNQAGDRILAVTSDGAFRSYRLPGMSDERVFKADIPGVKWDKPRYIGYRNYIAVQYGSGTAIYDDAGALLHKFEGLGAGGHHDFSPDGKWAYFTWRRGQPLEVHVVNIDGTGGRVVFRVPAREMRYVHNLHLAWPSGVKDWFIASFFPNANHLPEKYAPYLDEIVQIRLDGTHKILARSETAYSAPRGRSGGAQDMFWAQPLARPNAGGTRIAFNSNRAGTIDQCIVFTDSQGRPRPLAASH